MSEATVLLIEDDPAVRHGIAAFLRANGLDVDEADTCQKAVERFKAVGHDVVVADYSLPDGTSLDILPQVKKLSEETPFVILTAHGSIDLAVRAIKEGAEQFLTKPVESKALLILLKRLIQQQRLRKRQEVAARSQPGMLNPFVGTSPQIRRLDERAALMLEWDSPVLILGETGSGKGVLARWIHANGPRREEAFVNLNCAGLTRELLESELFGHERGAFTGAVNPKPGMLEVGHRGIVFLDEIGDMDPAIQPKLLKALEEMVRTKRFRDDLYYRISTLTLRIPPLRERPEDILILARNILASVCGRMGRPGAQLTREAEAVLTRYPWPGNIRELANVLERSMILVKGETLDAAGLGLDAVPPIPSHAESTLLTMKEMERLYVERVLAKTGGNVTEAATILGMARRTLYDRMRNLGLGSAKD